MSEDFFYEEITQIIKRVSNRTLEMKTNNIKLLNKVGFELSNVLNKLQDLIRIYQADKNDFIKEVEQIQFDFILMGKKIDEKFSINLPNQTNKSTTSSSLNQPERSSIHHQTNLQKILDTSDSSLDENYLEKEPVKSKDLNRKEKKRSIEDKMDKVDKNKISLVVPDTCCFEFPAIPIAKQNKLLSINTQMASNNNNNNNRLIIRETIDMNQYYNELENNKNSSQENDVVINDVTRESDLENTRIELEVELDERNENLNKNYDNNQILKSIDKFKNTNSTSQSTPVSVRKKLQEHGLLDLTNSPSKTDSQSSTHEKSQSLLKISNKTPKKKFHNNFSPLKESPSLLKQPLITSGLIKTPIKLFGRTSNPNSPSLSITKKTPTKPRDEIETQIESEANDLNRNETEKSLDSSFEFREHLIKRSKNKNSTKSSQLKSTNNLMNASKISTHFKKSTLNPENNERSLIEDISSPGKSTQNKPKRFKQLTMTQAFASQNDSFNKSNDQTKQKSTNPKVTVAQPPQFQLQPPPQPQPQPQIKNKFQFGYEKSSVSNKCLDETCLPTFNSENRGNPGISCLQSIKSEPIQINEFENEKEAQSIQSNSLENNYEDGNQPTNHLRSDYFADFDKVPKKKSKSPPFKHVQVVRKQDERKKLATSSCKECENYWNSLPEEMRPKRMDESCRHRAKFQAPPTPEHYWSISFPNTQECIERGYGGVIAENDKDDPLAQRRPRRKRPLKLIPNENKNKNKEGKNEDELSDFDFGEEN